MKVSIFTPTHAPKYLLDAYRSIRDQQYDEWLILPNNGAVVPDEILADSRTRIVGQGFAPKSTDGFAHIGSLKRHCCLHATGDILVELDHDDMLPSPAIDRIRDAFVDPSVVLAYSNCADFNDSDKSPRFFGNANTENLYDSINGWQYSRYEHGGVTYYAHHSHDPDPYHSSLVLWAPNHFRAFRRSTYIDVGGHDESLLALDDQDLICRMYCAGEFKHIDECLYLYRVDGGNSWLRKNKWIQDNMHRIQKQYIYQMILYWATSNNHTMIDLGGRFNCPDGFISVDRHGAKINTDLEQRWPFGDSSVGVVRAFDTIEHLKDPMHTMSELHRVLRPGGYALISVPSTDGRGAFQDPTHTSFWNENSFWYYTDRQFAQYIDNTTVRFKRLTLFSHYPSEWCREHNIPYVSTILTCLKNDYRPFGTELI